MKEKRGEHPFGDTGQLLLLALFLVVWVSDSFFLHWSTFLADFVPQPVRYVLLSLAVLTALNLVRTGHVVISGKERPNYVVDSGAFHYVRHPLIWQLCWATWGQRSPRSLLLVWRWSSPSFSFTITSRLTKRNYWKRSSGSHIGNMR